MAFLPTLTTITTTPPPPNWLDTGGADQHADGRPTGETSDGGGVAAPPRGYHLTRLYDTGLKRPWHEVDQDPFTARTWPPLPAAGHLAVRPLVRQYTAERQLAPELPRLLLLGNAEGRNALGLFLDPVTGIKYQVKGPFEADKAHNELMFAELGRRFGLNVPQLQLIEHDNAHYIASTFIENLKTTLALFPDCLGDTAVLARIARENPEVGKLLVVGALLNNLDIVGVACDNLCFLPLPDGKLIPYAVDFGGAGPFRGLAGTKPFKPEAPEFLSMTFPSLQANDGCIGAGSLLLALAPRRVLLETLDRCYSVPDAEIKAILARHLPDSRAVRDMFRLLMERRDSIRHQLETHEPNRLEMQLRDVAQYAITNAYDWDIEDDALTGNMLERLRPAMHDYLAENAHLMARSTGFMDVAKEMETIVRPWLDKALVERHPENRRMTEAEYKASWKPA